MKVSVNWIKQFLDFELPPIDELVEKIGAQLGEVEQVTDLGKKYEGVIVAKIVACEKHSNADKLKVCKIDDGGKAQNVERDENGRVQVVCGAPNVREGMLVAWLPPGSTVPDSYGKEPFVLEVRELRGVKSNGMLASPKELALGDSHDGILEIDKDAQPGDAFVGVYKLDDYIIDIENKMFTHRPDLFGALGIAREVAGILGHQFKSPEWYLSPELPVADSEGLRFEVENNLPDLVPRFMAVAISGVKVEPSPEWLQVALNKVGQKPINNIVDLTNFYMLVTGQPLHAYDYDKVKHLSDDTVKIVVRNPQQGEKIKLLNGKEIEPRNEAIMIAVDQKLIGVGGVMGGSETEVDENTHNIILECATFDMYSIRRTSMAHGLFTDAVTRFNKGQSPLQNPVVIAKAASDICKISGGKVASEFVDNHQQLPSTQVVETTSEFINSRLGSKLDLADIKTLLNNVEFSTTNDDPLTVTAPFWRMDIEVPEDIVEEVGRLYGFDKLPVELPQRTIIPAKKDEFLELKDRIRVALAKAGANEALTYSFVHSNLLVKAGQKPEDAFKLSNALSPDLQYYRLGLTPSLLEKVHPNIKAGYDEFALFEMGKAHNNTETDAENLPKEFDNLALVVTADDKHKKAGAPYYQARKYLDVLAKELGTDLRYESVTEEPNYAAAAPYDYSRSALVYIGDSDAPIGMVGEFKTTVIHAFKLPAYTAGFEIGVTTELLGNLASRYQQLSKYPKVTQDVSLKVPSSLSYKELFDFARQKLDEVKPGHSEFSLEPVDIYQREDDKDHKQMTLRLTIASHDKTMTDTEVSKILDVLADDAKAELSAERI